MAEYASRDAPAAVAPAAAAAINRRLACLDPLIISPSFSPARWTSRSAEAVGVGAGLGAMALAPLAVNP